MTKKLIKLNFPLPSIGITQNFNLQEFESYLLEERKKGV